MTAKKAREWGSPGRCVAPSDGYDDRGRQSDSPRSDGDGEGDGMGTCMRRRRENGGQCAVARWRGVVLAGGERRKMKIGRAHV